MNQKEMVRKNLVAQWAFDARPILGRLHLWLEDVKIEWARGNRKNDIYENISFVDDSLEKLFAMTAAGRKPVFREPL